MNEKQIEMQGREDACGENNLADVDEEEEAVEGVAEAEAETKSEAEAKSGDGKNTAGEASAEE